MKFFCQGGPFHGINDIYICTNIQVVCVNLGNMFRNVCNSNIMNLRRSQDINKLINMPISLVKSDFNVLHIRSRSGKQS